MPVNGTKPRRRLTREESRAQTRAALIAVGRRHFLRYGLGGAVADEPPQRLLGDAVEMPSASLMVSGLVFTIPISIGENRRGC